MNKIPTELAGTTDVTGVRAPLVTIVIVNYNYSEFLRQCIQSVDQQDYPNLQCIVVECASTDDSLSVIEETISLAKRPFFQLLRRDVNNGHLINALSAVENIKGAFVTFLDADDFLFPDFVSTHVKAHLNSLNSAALSVTDQIQIDAAGQVLAGTCHWHQKWRASEPGTVWTWNAIGKSPGAWKLAPDANEFTKGFILNHVISDRLPDGTSNSDPITGQAGWYDVRVRISPA